MLFLDATVLVSDFSLSTLDLRFLAVFCLTLLWSLVVIILSLASVLNYCILSGLLSLKKVTSCSMGSMRLLRASTSRFMEFF